MKADTTITITVSGKLLLSGEHSVFNGAPAVGLPLPLPLRLTFTPHTPSATKQLFSPTTKQLLSMYPRFIEEMERRIQEITNGDNGERNSGEIEIESEIPIGAGLGSSAALCVACAKLLHALRTRERKSDTRVVWNTAHQLESHFHGRSSGVDTGIITYSTPMIFRQPHQEHATTHTEGREISDPTARYTLKELGHSLTLIMAIVVLPRGENSTRNMIVTVNDERNRKAMHSFYTETERFATQCAELAVATENNSAPNDSRATTASATTLSHSIRQLHHLQQRLGISTTETSAFIEQAKHYGAEAGKVSGAGGGGAAFVLFRENNALTTALPKLIAFCNNRYQGQYLLYSGEWRGGKWHRFQNHTNRSESG